MNTELIAKLCAGVEIGDSRFAITGNVADHNTYTIAQYRAYGEACAAKATEAAQAENTALRMHWETRANFEALQAEVAKRATDRIKIVNEIANQRDAALLQLDDVQAERNAAADSAIALVFKANDLEAERDAALARLAELGKREPLFPAGELGCVSELMGEPHPALYAAAGASPTTVAALTQGDKQ